MKLTLSLTYTHIETHLSLPVHDVPPVILSYPRDGRCWTVVVVVVSCLVCVAEVLLVQVVYIIHVPHEGCSCAEGRF